MEIRYDKDADALYIKLRDGSFSKNKRMDDLTIFDLDSKGNILGIEILDASKRISLKSIREIRVKTPLAIAH